MYLRFLFFLIMHGLGLCNGVKIVQAVEGNERGNSSFSGRSEAALCNFTFTESVNRTAVATVRKG